MGIDGSDAREAIAAPTLRTYSAGRAAEHAGEVVEVHLSFGAVAQISATPDASGFLIRVWPTNGTHEYGGNNLTLLTVVVRYDEQYEPQLDALDWRSR